MPWQDITPVRSDDLSLQAGCWVGQVTIQTTTHDVQITHLQYTIVYDVIYEPDSEKIGLNSCVYIAYKNLFDVINKGKWFILGLILSKINAFQLVLIQFSVSFIDIHNKKYLKYQNIHILPFHLRAIFSERGSYTSIRVKQKSFIF